MGINASLLDEAKAQYIKGEVQSELKAFSPYFKKQFSAARFSEAEEDLEHNKETIKQLLKQRDTPEAAEVLYEEIVLYFDENRKWKTRYVVVRANYCLECHDSMESFVRGSAPLLTLLPTGGTVLTTEEKYMAMVDQCFPDNNNSVKEDFAPPYSGMPGQFPVYLRLPFRRDSYFCFRQQAKQEAFISTLSDCIRHQNQDFLKKKSCEVQAFLKAVRLFRQDRGQYEAWGLLIGSDVRVLANHMMQKLLPSLEKDLLPKLKAKKTEKKRVWFATVEAAYVLIQETLLEGLGALKEESREFVKTQEVMIHSDMDHIVSCRNKMEDTIRDKVSSHAERLCSECVQPYLCSVLEELMEPISGGFLEGRTIVETKMAAVCQDQLLLEDREELKKALANMRRPTLLSCYSKISSLQEKLELLKERFGFCNISGIIHSAQIDLQQLVENAAFTFEQLVLKASEENSSSSAMDKARLRVLKQYDYDSSTVRKRISREALVSITLPFIKKSLADTCKQELQSLEQSTESEHSNFVLVENVYEDILLQTLDKEVTKVVKEAASLKKFNLFTDSRDLLSQSSLSAPSSPNIKLASPITPNAKLASSPSHTPTHTPTLNTSPLAANANANANPLSRSSLSSSSSPPNSSPSSPNVNLASSPITPNAKLASPPSHTPTYSPSSSLNMSPLAANANANSNATDVAKEQEVAPKATVEEEEKPAGNDVTIDTSTPPIETHKEEEVNVNAKIETITQEEVKTPEDVGQIQTAKTEVPELAKEATAEALECSQTDVETPKINRNESQDTQETENAQKGAKVEPAQARIAEIDATKQPADSRTALECSKMEPLHSKTVEKDVSNEAEIAQKSSNDSQNEVQKTTVSEKAEEEEVKKEATDTHTTEEEAEEEVDVECGVSDVESETAPPCVGQTGCVIGGGLGLGIGSEAPSCGQTRVITPADVKMDLKRREARQGLDMSDANSLDVSLGSESPHVSDVESILEDLKTTKKNTSSSSSHNKKRTTTKMAASSGNEEEEEEEEESSGDEVSTTSDVLEDSERVRTASPLSSEEEKILTKDQVQLESAAVPETSPTTQTESLPSTQKEKEEEKEAKNSSSSEIQDGNTPLATASSASASASSGFQTERPEVLEGSSSVPGNTVSVNEEEPTKEKEEEEEEEAMDSVKCIRDLVFEVIEVEELVQRYPGGVPNPNADQE